MARPVRPWFRFYVEMPRDPKIRRLTPTQRWVWASILCAARQSPVAGHLLISEREPLNTADLADLAGVKESEAVKAVEAMERLGLVERDENLGCWFVPRFTARQYESDNVTARTRKHRERSNETQGNDVGTFQRRSRERDRNTPETETETEVPEPNGSGAGDTAQTLVAEWIEHCPKRPPSRVIGQVAREVRTMLDEGIGYADVRAGMQAWHTKRLHPSALASVVHEQRTPRPSTTDQRVAAGGDLITHFAQLEAQQPRAIEDAS